MSNPLAHDVFGKPLDWGTKDGKPPVGAMCCRGVCLSHPFLDYDASYKSAVAGRKTFCRTDGVESYNIPDVLTVGPMIRLVGVVNRDPFGVRPDLCPPRKVWRCIHANEANDFRCDIYEKRPQMCRMYPANVEGGKCEFKTCGSVHCPNHPSHEVK
jgi:Fe-S-cluster containining protein